MEGMGEGRIITMVCDFGEPAPPKKDLGARPLNSLNLTMMYSREYSTTASGALLRVSRQLIWTPPVFFVPGPSYVAKKITSRN